MAWRKWTDNELDYLNENYSNVLYSDLVKYFNRTKKAIRRKANGLGLKKNKDCRSKTMVCVSKKKKNAWSDNGIRFLLNNYKKMEYKDIANVLNKTEMAIRHKCSSLNLIKIRNWTKNEIEYLKNNHAKNKSKLLSTILNKSVVAVRLKAEQLGLSCIKKIKNKTISPEFCYVLGSVLGDGTVLKYDVRLNVKDKDFALEFKRSFDKWSGLKTAYYEYRGYYIVTLQSKDGAMFFREFDKEIMLNVDKNMQSNFLRGLYDSEGCVGFYRHSRQIGFFNTDISLINLVRKILKNFSIKTRLYSRKRGEWKRCYELYIGYREGISNFYNNVGFSIFRKQNKLNAMLNSYDEVV